MSDLNLVAEAGGGRLYEANGFLVPVLTGSAKEMGTQYGSLMVEHMQTTYDVLVAPGRSSGVITDEVARAVTERAYATLSPRNRLFYDGVVEGSGWSLDNVGMLDQSMEFGMYQSKLHSFAGCTSIVSWGGHSADGGTYVGRNMDWGPAFNEFAQVLAVYRPTDGSYRHAIVGWPGVYCAFTTLNEHGAYMDVHDGTSMGGSIVYEERPPLTDTLIDLVAESASLSALVRRLNGTATSLSLILTLADETSGASMECSSLGGNRLRPPEGESMVVVNTFLDSDWGLGRRETVSNSLRRFDNMTARLGEHAGEMDAALTRKLMDLTLFDDDGSFAVDGGCTKPTKVDADLTNHQVVTDIGRRQMWLKVPVPNAFADWTHFDLNALWG